MLVDDEVTILEGFKKLFDWDKYGCEVVGEALDGAMAINQADLLVPDLMIVDVNIPIISGLKVVEILRAKYSKMEFIIVSGYDEFEYCRKALRMRIADYILKPVDFSEFGRVINQLRANAFHEQFENESEMKEIDDSKDDGTLIFRMTSYMQNNISKDISLQILSDEFHLNPSYISQMFKNKTGMNYHKYLEHLRIVKAKKMLVTTSKSISEISTCVGFGNYRIFTKVFKNKEGMLPSQFKRCKTGSDPMNRPHEQNMNETGSTKRGQTPDCESKLHFCKKGQTP